MTSDTAPTTDATRPDAAAPDAPGPDARLGVLVDHLVPGT